jgi:hypothetical protein
MQKNIFNYKPRAQKTIDTHADISTIIRHKLPIIASSSFVLIPCCGFSSDKISFNYSI